MTNLQYLMESVSSCDRQYLSAADFLGACQQLDAGVPYSRVIGRLRDWAQDYRREAACEAVEALRFEADH